MNCNMKVRITALLVASIAATLTSCSRPKAPPPSPPKVTVALPQIMTVTNWDEYPGHLQAVEMVETRPRVSGYIDSIHFTDGAEVTAGDLLFVIDPRPYQAAVDQAKAERQRAETRSELTSNDLQRAESLRGTRAISEEEYDSRSKAAREAEAALAAARAAEAADQLNLDYTRITAAISGKIGCRLVTVGNLVQGGAGAASTLTTIVTMDPVYCNFDASEEALPRYNHDGSAQHAPLACELALVGEDGFPHKGHVDFFDNQVDARTGTIRVRGVFANADRTLVPGMFATVRVPAGPPESTLLIPDVAVGFDQNYKFVYVVNSTNVVETRIIMPGRSLGPLRAVLKGLTPQDRVVVNGLTTLRPGTRVEAQVAPAPAAPLAIVAAAGNSSTRP